MMGEAFLIVFSHGWGRNDSEKGEYLKKLPNWDGFAFLPFPLKKGRLFWLRQCEKERELSLEFGK
jgi:hypothetical protein